MIIPDVVGLTIEQGKKLLSEAGYIVDKVVVTSPPRESSTEYNDEFRIVRINSVCENRIELLACKPL